MYLGGLTLLNTWSIECFAKDTAILTWRYKQDNILQYLWNNGFVLLSTVKSRVGISSIMCTKLYKEEDLLQN